MALVKQNPILVFRVVGEPSGQARPRFHRIGEKGVAIYVPKNPWYYAIMQKAQELSDAGFVPIYSPVMVKLDFYMKRIKSLPKTKEIPHIKKPDIDNLAKLFLDAITPTILADDKLVIELHVKKRYAKKEETPGCVASINEM
jgi:Holliday junction resolvase RusA-like endonuclease